MRSLIVLLFTTALAAQNSVEFTGRYWIPQMAGRIRVEAAGFGTDIDARNDLGIADTNFPQGAFAWQKGRSRLSFCYTPIDYSGDQNVNRTIVFRGQPYTVGTRVVSEVEVQHLQVNWTYQFIRVKEGLFRLGPMIQADGFLMHGSLAAPNVGFAQKEDLSAGLPSVGLALDLNPNRHVNIYGQVAGMQVGSYGYFVGSDAGVKVTLRSHLLLTAGYRTFNLHVENAPDFARLRLRGPFVGAGFRF